MNQSIDKLANLLLARKAIHSLPANTSLTLRELNALVLECQGNSAAAMATMETVTSAIRPSAHSFSGLKSDTKEVYQNQRHPHQAPLSITNAMVASHHTQLESSQSSRFQISVRQLSSSSSTKKR
mmetsp:Transcript_1472/g.3408  ORF Transcript_1472/g.3408 Transcript_1472/m.3408 type:complete len:125 (-) Transcript_1472:263-637(-)|eukprot:CAMPEP_0116101230 /NCGR_PEP_ID=MMETSP0327-20121206/12701_1 /TAXON_ID=44447 /ORGANISM="Pseudo-nitzschia delicatissima, Strain B596" /LENGTH=124 /DNA_ID=CAMNT_0003593181 /DNA_START=104 /DNA_END=478 /DNA_ORIENTATION=-